MSWNETKKGENIGLEIITGQKMGLAKWISYRNYQWSAWSSNSSKCTSTGSSVAKRKSVCRTPSRLDGTWPTSCRRVDKEQHTLRCMRHCGPQLLLLHFCGAPFWLSSTETGQYIIFLRYIFLGKAGGLATLVWQYKSWIIAYKGGWRETYCKIVH